MNKKLEEKILAAIRSKVIEKDHQRQSKKEQDEMREANIEALTELTSLSREEVEKIASEVKTDVLKKRSKQRKNIIITSIIGLICAYIVYLVVKPEPEPTITTFSDDFSSNNNNWRIFNKFTNKREFKFDQYVMNTNKEDWCYWDDMSIKLPKNFDVIVSSTWLDGKSDEPFGIGLNYSNSSYYAFRLRGDGKAKYAKVVEKEWVINNSYKNSPAKTGENATNIQKVEVRGDKFKYYINDELFEEGKIELEINAVALRCCGKQKIAYNSIQVINSNTDKVIFEDDFTDPSEDWEPDEELTMISYFEKGKYIMHCNHDDKCYWANSTVEVTADCEIELSSYFLSGTTDTYGMMVLNDDNNYYACEIQSDGNARLVECLYDEYTDVQGYINAGISGKDIPLIQKVKIKDGTLTYYVNDVLIKEKNDIALFFPCRLALRICGEQHVAFDQLDIKYFTYE